MPSSAPTAVGSPLVLDPTLVAVLLCLSQLRQEPPIELEHLVGATRDKRQEPSDWSLGADEGFDALRRGAPAQQKYGGRFHRARQSPRKMRTAGLIEPDVGANTVRSAAYRGVLVVRPRWVSAMSAE